MKKMAALLLVLTLLATGGSMLVGFSVNRGREQVTMETETLYGNPAVAQGLRVRSKVDDGAHLFWDITYRAGEGTEAAFYFNAQGREAAPWWKEDAFQLYDALENCDVYHMSGEQAEQSGGLVEIYWELAQQLEVGEEKNFTVDLQPYLVNYPLDIDISLPGTLYLHNDVDEDYSSDEAAVRAHFQEFFTIPIEAPQPVELHVERPAEDWCSGSVEQWQEMVYQPETLSTHTDSRCFFTIKNHTPDGQKIDMSQIPGGYGIYGFSYERVTNWDGHSGGFKIPAEYKTGVDAQSLRMVFPLEDTTEVLALQADGYRNELQMVTREADGTYFTSIDLGDMTVKEKIPLFSKEPVEIFRDGNVWAVICQGQLTVLDCRENGKYERLFTVTMPEVLAKDFYSQTDFYHENGKHDYGNVYLQYQDGKLAFLQDGQKAYFLAVVDREGVQYCGKLRSSLQMDINTGERGCEVYETELAWE